MSGLTNEYLTKLGKKLFGKTFLGSFPCDYNPKITDENKFSIIFNLSKHNEDGTHFVAIFCDMKKLVYFDSFGDSSKNEYINKFIKKHLINRKYVENKTRIQSCESYFCGLFCICFIGYLFRNKTLNQFLKIFQNKDLLENDQIVTKCIIKMFK